MTIVCNKLFLPYFDAKTQRGRKAAVSSHVFVTSAGLKFQNGVSAVS